VIIECTLCVDKVLSI